MALLNWGMICPHPEASHPARSFGSDSPLPSLGAAHRTGGFLPFVCVKTEGLGVRAKSTLHTLIQQRPDYHSNPNSQLPTPNSQYE
jgi:hypothetical protein